MMTETENNDNGHYINNRPANKKLVGIFDAAADH